MEENDVQTQNLLNQVPSQYSPVAPPAKQKNWFARHKVLTAFGVVLVLAGAGGAAGGSGSKGTDTATQSKPASTSSHVDKGSVSTGTTPVTDNSVAPPAAVKSTNGGATGSATLPLSDGDWRMDTLTVSEESYTNDFTGRARITYIGHDSKGGDNAFTITVFKAGKDVATLTGFVSDVAPGSTKTVDLLSTDTFVSGAKTYSFQNDWQSLRFVRTAVIGLLALGGLEAAGHAYAGHGGSNGCQCQVGFSPWDGGSSNWTLRDVQEVNRTAAI